MGVDHTYRYVNASNVYAKGKADGGSSIRYFFGRFYGNSATQVTSFYLGIRPTKLIVFYAVGMDAAGGAIQSIYWNGGSNYTTANQPKEDAVHCPDATHRIGYDAYNYTGPSSYVKTGNTLGSGILNSINNDGFTLMHGWSTIANVICIYN